MERAQVIETCFSVADTDYPDISMEEGDLFLRFTDWTGKRIEIYFFDVIAFKWQMIESFIEGEAFDRCHEIINSYWLQQHKQQGTIAEAEEYKHYKFNFNACGQFEVIVNGFSKRT